MISKKLSKNAKFRVVRNILNVHPIFILGPRFIFTYLELPTCILHICYFRHIHTELIWWKFDWEWVLIVKDFGWPMATNEMDFTIHACFVFSCFVFSGSFTGTFHLCSSLSTRFLIFSTTFLSSSVLFPTLLIAVFVVFVSLFNLINTNFNNNILNKKRLGGWIFYLVFYYHPLKAMQY